MKTENEEARKRLLNEIEELLSGEESEANGVRVEKLIERLERLDERSEG